MWERTRLAQRPCTLGSLVADSTIDCLGPDQLAERQSQQGFEAPNR